MPQHISRSLQLVVNIGDACSRIDTNKVCVHKDELIEYTVKTFKKFIMDKDKIIIGFKMIVIVIYVDIYFAFLFYDSPGFTTDLLVLRILVCTRGNLVTHTLYVRLVVCEKYGWNGY